MEDIIVGVLSSMAGLAGYIIGVRFQPRNKTLAAQARWYEEELGNMRTEVKRYRAKASYFAKGAVSAEVADAGSPEALVDAILTTLPPNFRNMVAPFRQQILQHAKENPDVVRAITDAVRQKISGPKGEENAIQNEYL